MMHVSGCVRGVMSLYGVVLAAALATGCGAAGRSPRTAMAAPPASPREARAELARLELQIDSARATLGLPAQAKKEAGGDAESKPPVSLDFAPAETPQAMARPPDAEEVDQQRQSACSDNCRLSRAICHAARRICTIAGYLGDEDAAGRCKRARQDCKEARQAKSEDCSGCR